MPYPKFQTKEGKEIDKCFKQISRQVEDGDVILPVFGPTKCGKSTFIDSLLPPDATKRPQVRSNGAAINPCELFVVESGPFRRNSDYRKLPGRLVVIDTPGFQNSYASDEKVAQDIAACIQWLLSQRKVCVAGAIVMASIETDCARPVRSGSLSDRLQLEQGTLSEPSPPPIAIVTTHWDVFRDHAEARRREGVLRKSVGSRGHDDTLMFRFYKDGTSAWKAVDGIVREFVSSSDLDERGASASRMGGPGRKSQRAQSASLVRRLIRFVVGLIHGQLPVSLSTRGR